VLATWSCALFAQAAPDAVYRFYNRETGTHFYTVSVSERDDVIRAFAQFAYEGAAFAALSQPRADSVPVFRFYNKTTGTHFYTTSVSERDGIVAYYPQFVYEGPAFHALAAAGTDGRTAVFRFFNKNTGSHFYTASAVERDKVIATYAAFVYEGVAFYVYPASTATVAPVVVRSSDAWRFLAQTSFFPTQAELARASAIGVHAYLEEQFAQPPSGYPDSDFYYLSLDESPACSFGASRSSAAYVCARDQLTLFKFRNTFFTNARAKPDQLRQRVAWALSQFFVISGMKDPDMEAAYVQSRYHQILFEEAFGNVGRLLWRVTLSPQMGHYLDMVDNRKADPVKGTQPNENYARELLQLFSIGTVELALDGTPLLDAKGAPIATYGQAEGEGVRTRADRVDVSTVRRGTTGQQRRSLLRASDGRQGGTPRHGRQDAVERRGHARRTARTGRRRHGGRQRVPAPERGAVLCAARDPPAGHQQSVPGVRRARRRRVQRRRHRRSRRHEGDPARGAARSGSARRRQGRSSLRRAARARAVHHGDPARARRRHRRQPPVRAGGRDGTGRLLFPTVFNYYPADYRIPGTTLVAPQFGIHNTNTVLHRANFVSEMIDEGGWSPDTELAGAVGTKIDITPFRNVAASPSQLVNLINAKLFGGGMPLGLRDEVYNAVAALPASQRGERARTALFLTLTSFQFQVMR
jgi:hypothetical protein